MNMREKLVAAAIKGLEKSDDVGVIGGEGADFILDGRFNLFDVVDAILDELREPTSAMQSAGNWTQHDQDQTGVGDIWRAMIDAVKTAA